MKTSWKYVMMAVLIAISATSCKDDEVSGIEGPENGGETTYMSLKFVQPTSYAYNPGGNNVTAEEQVVNKVHVFFLSSGSIEVKEAIYAAGSNDDEWLATVPATTGRQSFVVGLNLTTDMVNLVETGWINAQYASQSTKLLDDIAELYSAANGFVMFSVAEQEEVIALDPAENQFTVQVERIVAKVYVEEADGLNKTASGATFSGLAFAMGQVNTKMYPVKYWNSTNMVEDPNFSFDAADLVSITVNGKSEENVPYYTDFVSQFRPDGYKQGSIDQAAFLTVGVENATSGNLNVKYMPENTSKNQYRGELTYACIRANFVPDQIATYEDDGNGTMVLEFNPNTNTGTQPDYYVVRTKANEYLYFEDPDQADDYYADYQAIVYEPEVYEDGLCYYHVLFNKGNGTTVATNNYDIIRNEFYSLKITKISQLGYNKPEITDPEIPIGQDTSIEILIEVQPWNFVEEDIQLGR
ncbi:MAG: Mfa1 family fimbria major subunit [Tannerellaceae bacterium]|nr:Mfa1 family fimbria major subunit [Tannerellaceae bacterium]